LILREVTSYPDEYFHCFPELFQKKWDGTLKYVRTAATSHILTNSPLTI